MYETAGCTSCGGGLGDRLLQETTPLGSINYTYDNIGRRTGMTLSGQPQVTYTYDNDSRLTSLSTKIGSSTRTYPLTYDKGSRRTSLKIPVSLTNKYVTTTYNPYDNANRIKGITHQGPSVQIENLLYEYDPAGNRIKFTRNAIQPSRDAVNSTSYDEANEMLTFQPSLGSAKNMTYDENGNLLTIINSCGTTTYTWDVRNRLVGITGFKADCSALTASFKYDAVGRRIQKTINGTTTQYVYDGLDIIQEKQGGTVTANYIRTLNIDEPLTRIKGSTVRHYVLDALGSVIALTDDTGALKTTYTYDPFGNVTISGESSDNPFQYTGRENDGTGLYYYRARYYSPELQRFISEDPIGLAGGINLYSYVGNNPVNFVDPLGLLTEVVIWQPTGWGRSSFGHVSVNINGTTYSFEPAGMRIMPTTNYLAKNAFREGVGKVLNITPEQEATLNNFLKNYNKGYGRLTNNCGDPIESGLENLGYGLGTILFPVSFGNTLMDLNMVNNYNFYQATQPKNGTSAPWTRK